MNKVVFQGDPGKPGTPGTPGLRVSRRCPGSVCSCSFVFNIYVFLSHFTTCRNVPDA